MNKIISVIIFSLFFLSTAQSQQLDFSHTAMEKRIKKDILFLASDSLGGRESGTHFETMARDYIAAEFLRTGLSPLKPNGSFFQPFFFHDGVNYGKRNFLSINKAILELGEEYYPLAKSGNGMVSSYIVNVGFGLNTLQHDDYRNRTDLEGKVFVIEVSVPGGKKNFPQYAEFANLDKKIELAIAMKAKAILFINSDKTFENPSAILNSRITPVSIPVIFVSGKAAKKLKSKKPVSIELNVNLQKNEVTSYNIIGAVNTNLKKTLVIGAHYDHLGMGRFGSKITGKIHNGADDNASGTAAIMELARYFSVHQTKNINLLFIAFSAEEKGIIGSTHFTNSKDYDMGNVIAMFNFDMVGRVDSSTKILILNGTGTSPVWDSLISNSNNNRFDIKKSTSGVGGSDHAAFYLSEKPVLFFFTGVHEDYHTPNDDVEKINFSGIVEVVNYSKEMIQKIDNNPEIPFIKTQDNTTGRSPMSRGATLGVMPDHTFDGKGMRFAGVIGGKPAALAGFQKGDIVIQIDEHIITDINTYMKALSFYKKGNSAKIRVLREEKYIEKEVSFE